MWPEVCIYVEYMCSYKPLVDTARILNVHKFFRRWPWHLLNILCAFNVCPVSMVKYVCKTCQSIQYKDSLSKIILWRSNWVNQFQIQWLHKIFGVPGTLFYKSIPRATKSPASHVCLPQFYFFYHLPAFWKKVNFCLIRLNDETLLFTFSQAAANIFKYFAHTPNKESTY